MAIPRVRSFDLVPGCEPLNVAFARQTERLAKDLRAVRKPVQTKASRLRDEGGVWHLTDRGTSTKRFELAEAPSMPKKQEYRD